jgi:hypothetical protein
MGLRTPSGPLDALQFIALMLCIVILQMLFLFVLEGWPFGKIKGQAGYLFAANAFSDTATWTKAPVDLCVSISGLNFIGAVVILHAVLWRRSPISVAAPPAGPVEQQTVTGVEEVAR